MRYASARCGICDFARSRKCSLSAAVTATRSSLKHLRRRRGRRHVVAVIERLGRRVAALVDGADLDIRAEELDRACDEPRGAVRPVDLGRRRLAAGPLERQQRRDVGSVIVVQMRQEQRAHALDADARRDELAHGAVAAVEEIRHAVDDDGARALAADEVDAGPAARAEQHELRPLGDRRRAARRAPGAPLVRGRRGALRAGARGPEPPSAAPSASCTEPASTRRRLGRA